MRSKWGYNTQALLSVYFITVNDMTSHDYDLIYGNLCLPKLNEIWCLPKLSEI